MHAKSHHRNLVIKTAGIAFALGLALSGRVNAQGNSASISGTVSDSSGAAIPKAAVQVKNLGTGQVQQTPADARASYTVPDIPGYGDYKAQASAQGFQTVVRRGITLTVGAQSVVDFSLPVGQSQQTLTVDATVSQVDTVSTAVGTTVEQTQIADLPLNGRNFTDLVALIPGVSSDPQDRKRRRESALRREGEQLSVSGARAEGQAYLLDGTDIQGFWDHGSGSGVMGTWALRRSPSFRSSRILTTRSTAGMAPW